MQAIYEIRCIEENRWQEYRDLRLEALREDSAAFGSSYEEDIHMSEADWKKRLPNARFALVDGKPVGMLALVFNERIKTKHIAEIFGVYVKPAYRRRGAGRQLMQSALEETRSHGGIVKVKLTVNPSQKAAVRLYKRLGFKTVGCMKRELFTGGRFYDEAAMEKYL